MQESKTGAWPTQSKVLRFADMPVRRNANGSESRDTGGGAIPTGERVRVHESMQVGVSRPTRPTPSTTRSSSACAKVSWSLRMTAEPIAPKRAT